MGTSVLAVVFFMAIIMMTATLAVLAVVYSLRLPSSKTSRKSPGAGESRDDVKPPRGARKSPKLGTVRKRRVPGKQTPEMQGPVELTAPGVHPPLDYGQPAPAPETPIEVAETTTVATPATLSETREETEPAIKETVQERAPQNTEARLKVNAPVVVAISGDGGKENATSMDNKPGTEPVKRGPEAVGARPVATPPAETGKSQGEAARSEKPTMGDLSDLFSRESSQDSKTNRLAEGLDDVDANSLLQQGLGLVSRLKKRKE